LLFPSKGPSLGWALPAPPPCILFLSSFPTDPFFFTPGLTFQTPGPRQLNSTSLPHHLRVCHSSWCCEVFFLPFFQVVPLSVIFFSISPHLVRVPEPRYFFSRRLFLRFLPFSLLRRFLPPFASGNSWNHSSFSLLPGMFPPPVSQTIEFGCSSHLFRN